MPTVSILDKCKEAYKRSGLTYDELAEKSGISRTTVNTYLNNPPKKPRPATVKQLADTLGVDASAIPETNEQPENASEMFMVNHCAACREVTALHNKELREDFNARFSAMESAYKAHEELLVKQYEQRIRTLSTAVKILVIVIAVATVAAAVHVGVDWAIIT